MCKICSRPMWTITGCANQPLLLSRHRIRRYFLLHPEFHNRKGCFLHEIGETRYCSISGAGRPPRLGDGTVSRYLKHPLGTSNVVHRGFVGFIPALKREAFSLIFRNAAENMRATVTPSPAVDRSNGCLAQPSVRLFDTSTGRVAPQEQVRL